MGSPSNAVWMPLAFNSRVRWMIRWTKNGNGIFPTIIRRLLPRCRQSEFYSSHLRARVTYRRGLHLLYLRSAASWLPQSVDGGLLPFVHFNNFCYSTLPLLALPPSLGDSQKQGYRMLCKKLIFHYSWTQLVTRRLCMLDVHSLD